MIEPDVFWSDIILGLIASYAAFRLYRLKISFWLPFAFLTLATWVGAFYHGFIDHTDNLPGEILWTSTLLLFYAASASIIVLLNKNRLSIAIASIGFVLYAYWAIAISEKFIWALLLQGVAILIYLVACLWRTYRTRNPRIIRATLWLLLFIVIDAIAIFVQQTMQTFGLDISHNTIFHIIEMPALVALAISMYSYEVQKTI